MFNVYTLSQLETIKEKLNSISYLVWYMYN